MYFVLKFDRKIHCAKLYLSSKIKTEPSRTPLENIKSSSQLKDSIFSVFEKVIIIKINNMYHYYVHTLVDENGDHEVHKEGCDKMPNIENRTYLGIFSSCREAVKKAKEIYPRSNGCYWCSRECHTS